MPDVDFFMECVRESFSELQIAADTSIVKSPQKSVKKKPAKKINRKKASKKAVSKAKL